MSNAVKVAGPKSIPAVQEPEPPRLTLLTVGYGAAVELFEQELKRVLENVLDPNTEPEAKRAITLKVTVTPNKERTQIGVSVEADSRLAPFRGAGSVAFIGRKRGEVIAVAHDPRQMQMSWEADGRPKPLHADTEIPEGSDGK